jgi:hypothetical protein
MSKNPISQGSVTDKFRELGELGPDLIRTRAHELAVIAGRTPPVPTPADYDQARRELTGGPDLDPETAAIEALPESERWDPMPGSSGQEAPALADEESDEEGRNESAQLVEEGMKEAEHDQMLQAARAPEKDEAESDHRKHKPKQG